jgi:LysM repeat protein
MVRNIIIKPNVVEEHSVYIEMEVEISCVAYEEKEIRVIQDIYCPGQKMEFKKSMVNTITDKQCKRNMCNLREKINVPELEMGTIVDVGVNPIINKENRVNGKILYEGEVDLNFIFTDNSAVGINTKKITVPFEQTVEGILDNCRLDTSIEVNSQEFVNQAGTVSVNLDLNLETDSYRSATIPLINDISTTPQEELEDYSVIIYVVKAGDTLWKIAKRFGSTVNDIIRVNGIERPDRLNIGEKIYIPRYVSKQAREPITLSVNV